MNAYRTRMDMSVQYSKATGSWKIEDVSATAKKNYASTGIYGTKRMHAYAILEGILNNSSLQVKDRKKDEYGNDIQDDKGHYILVVNEEETKAVSIVAKQMNTDFEDWIFKDPVRREALVDKYNERLWLKPMSCRSFAEIIIGSSNLFCILHASFFFCSFVNEVCFR